MSYTAIRGFSLGSRPPLPLGGGNVAALQHEGRVGSGDQEGPAEGRCSRAPLGSRRPSARASGALGRGQGAARGSRRPAGQSASPLQRGGRPGGGTGSPARHEPRQRWLGSWARGAGSGRVGTPGHLAGVPATRARIRLRRPVRTEPGATPGRLGGSQPAGSWTLDAWTPGCCSEPRLPPFRVAPARVASQGRQPQLPADEEVGEGGWPGG